MILRLSLIWTTILHYSSVAPFTPLSSFVWTSIGIWKVFGGLISLSCLEILAPLHLMQGNFLVKWLTRAFSSLVAHAKFSSRVPWFLFSFLEKLLVGFNHANLTIWLTPTLRIWSSLWSCSSVFNHVSLIIWLTLTLRIWSSFWLYSLVFNHANSCFGEFDRHYDHARPNWTLCDDFTPIETFIVYLVLLVGLSMASFFLEIFFLVYDK